MYFEHSFITSLSITFETAQLQQLPYQLQQLPKDLKVWNTCFYLPGMYRALRIQVSTVP